MRVKPALVAVGVLIASACGVEARLITHPLTTVGDVRGFLQSSTGEVKGRVWSFSRERPSGTIAIGSYEPLPDAELVVRRGEVLVLSYTTREAPKRLSAYYYREDPSFSTDPSLSERAREIKVRASNPATFRADFEPGPGWVQMGETWTDGDDELRIGRVFKLSVK